jgi:hypothetical protein
VTFTAQRFGGADEFAGINANLWAADGPRDVEKRYESTTSVED